MWLFKLGIHKYKTLLVFKAVDVYTYRKLQFTCLDPLCDTPLKKIGEGNGGFLVGDSQHVSDSVLLLSAYKTYLLNNQLRRQEHLPTCQ